MLKEINLTTGFAPWKDKVMLTLSRYSREKQCEADPNGILVAA